MKEKLLQFQLTSRPHKVGKNEEFKLNITNTENVRELRYMYYNLKKEYYVHVKLFRLR